MPTPLIVKPEELQLLREMVETRLGFLLKDTYDCKRAAEQLLENGESISYNTLRRIFHVVPSSHAPSRHVMNSLCRFVGIPSWDEFHPYAESKDTEAFSQLLHVYYRYGYVDPQKLTSFVQNESWDRWEFAFKYRDLIEAAARNNDFSILSLLLNFQLQQYTIGAIEKMFVAIEPLYLKIRENNQDWMAHVQIWLHQNETFRRILLEFYVDESALSGYYGQLISIDFLGSSPQFKTFQSLMMIQKYWINDSFEEAKKIFDLVEQDSNCYQFHPIPWARYAVWEYVITNSLSAYHKFWNESNDLWEQMAFANFFNRLCNVLDVYNASLWVDLPVGALSAPYRLFDSTNLYGYHTQAAWHWMKQGNLSKSRLHFEKINIYRVESDYFEWYFDRYQAVKHLINPITE